MDAGALIDLGACGRLSSWRVLVLCWRGAPLPTNWVGSNRPLLLLPKRY